VATHGATGSPATTPLDAHTPLRALAQRSDIPLALREAAAAFLERGARPTTDLLAAAQARDLPSVMTALMALDGEALVDAVWQPLATWLAMPAAASSAARFRVTVPRGDPGGPGSSAYRERACGAGLVGVAAVIQRQARDGPIASVHVALCGVGPLPIRARQTEATLRGRRPAAYLVELAAETARHEAQPFGAGTVLDLEALAAVRDVSREALSAILGA